MTRTFALLEVAPSMFDEVRAKLEGAGYDHAFHEHDGRSVIDMHGLALVAGEPSGRDAERGDALKLDAAQAEIARRDRMLSSAARSSGESNRKLHDLTAERDKLQAEVETAQLRVSKLEEAASIAMTNAVEDSKEIRRQQVELDAARRKVKYWRDGTKLIEECLAKATKADPGDAPFPLVGDEVRLWHIAQLNAYRHALEMMGHPEANQAAIDASRVARDKAGG